MLSNFHGLLNFWSISFNLIKKDLKYHFHFLKKALKLILMDAY